MKLTYALIAATIICGLVAAITGLLEALQTLRSKP